MNEVTTRGRILAKGLPIVMSKGFQATGLQEILAVSGVPKGSFYHFFPSKEQFGLELIDYFINSFWHELEVSLDDRSATPLERLHQYFTKGIKLLQELDLNGGCPIGNLAQEMCETNTLFRQKLSSIYDSIIIRFANVLEEACREGDLTDGTDCEAMATFIFNSWEGAIIHMKVTRSIQPLLVFKKTIFDILLAGMKTP